MEDCIDKEHDPHAEVGPVPLDRSSELELRKLFGLPADPLDWVWEHDGVRKRSVLFVGEYGIGKSTAIETYLTSSFVANPSEQAPPSSNNDFKGTFLDLRSTKDRVGIPTSLDDVLPILFNDVGTTQTYDIEKRLTYPGTDCFVLCISMADTEITDCRIHAHHIRRYARDAPIVLAGAKFDLVKDPESRAKQKRPVTLEQCEEMAKTIGAFKFVAFSSRTRENLDLLFETIAAAILAKLEKKKRSYKPCHNQ